MPVCSYCGLEVGQGAETCAHCGQPVDEARGPAAVLLSADGPVANDATLAPTDPGGSWPSAEPSMVIGGYFAGYLVEDVAGRGGMGVVYRARDEQLGRSVALKVIDPAVARDPSFRERFKRESRMAAQIEHPNVVPVYGAGEEAQQLYIAMRYVDGIDLATLLAERGRLEPHDAARLVAQVARALDAAHARGLVHRDVKPGNVLLSGPRGDERAYLTDFGLSVVGGAQGAMTRTGQWVGTLAYVAPEQIRGADVDARTDVYALGGVLHHCLTGSVPFPAEHELDALSAHLSRPPPRPSATVPGLPAALDRVVRRAMGKAPADRFPSAGDLGRAALAASRGERPPRGERSVATGHAAPRPVHGRGRVWEGVRRRRAWVLGLAAAAVLAVVAAVALTGGGGSGGGDRGASGSRPGEVRAGRPIALDLAPDHVAALDGRVWSVTADVGRLQRVDPRTRRVDQFPPAVDLGGGAYAGVAAGAGSIWVAHDVDEGGVDRVDPANGEGTDHVSLPRASAVTATDDAVWAAYGGPRRATGNLARIDPRTVRATGARLDAGRDPVALALGDGSLWVVNRAPGTLTRIDTRSGVGARSSPWAAGRPRWRSGSVPSGCSTPATTRSRAWTRRRTSPSTCPCRWASSSRTSPSPAGCSGSPRPIGP